MVFLLSVELLVLLRTFSLDKMIPIVVDSRREVRAPVPASNWWRILQRRSPRTFTVSVLA